MSVRISSIYSYALKVLVCTSLLIGGGAAAAHAQYWGELAVISPTAPLSTSTVGGLCYTDGAYIACDGTVAAFDLENGRLGIGTSSPDVGLDVANNNIQITGGSALYTFGQGSINEPNATWGSFFSTAGGNTRFITAGKGTYASAIPNMFFSTFDGSTITDMMFIASSTGNVGIGTTAPTTTLEVAGTISATGLTVSGTANVDALVVNGTAITGGGASSIDGLADAAKNDTDYNIFLGHTGGSVGAEDDDNIAIGHTALDSLNNSGGDYNIALGRGALTTNTEGDYNIAIGYEALNLATTGANTAVGFRAGYQISGTVANVSAMGYHAAFQNTGTNVSAMGYLAAYQNTGSQVSAMGVNAAYQNTGANVSAMGYVAAFGNTGSNISAMGYQAAYQNTGAHVSAMGVNAAFGNTGANISAMGYGAAYQNNGSNASVFGYETIRYRNASNTTAIGYQAGRGGDTTRQNILNGTFLGYRAGYGVGEGANNNLYLGYDVGQGTHTGSNNILIGYDIDPSSGTASNELNIGNLVYGNTSVDRVGINVPSPTTTLEVAGTISATGLTINGEAITAGASFAPTATANLNMATNDIQDAGTVETVEVKVKTSNITPGADCTGKKGVLVYSETYDKFFICKNG